jgi:serine/threonine protein kinase
MSNLVGQQIAHYQILALLGEGRIGTVYQAIDLKDRISVALKVVSLHLTHQVAFRRRFLQEVQAIPTLDHPSIIKVHEAGVDTEQDILYMTMDYVTERSLLAYMQQLEFRDEQMRPGEGLLIAADVADALGYAHQKGVLHRDIRPNVILFKLEAEAGGKDTSRSTIGGLPRRAVIGDFALASVLEEETEPFAPALPYMSPEQCLKKEMDGRSDLYSLGILLYQLLTRQLPFSVETMDDAIRQHQFEDPIPPRQIRPDLPQVVEDVIMKAIAKRPDDRYQTGMEMAEALRRSAVSLPESLAVPLPQDEISSVQTLFEAPEQLALQASNWSSDEDRVTITQDVPYRLNRQIVTIGRSESNDITLPAPGVTRRHAQLERTATGWQIRDLGSKNGTFLDGLPLLPDIPEEWLSQQTLRIGPYFLQLHEGKGFALAVRPFDVLVTPDEIEVRPGQQTELQVTVLNHGAESVAFEIEVERIPPGWVTAPEEPLRVRAGHQATATIAIHPPLSSDVIPGRNRYLVNVRALKSEQGVRSPLEEMAIPGIVNVISAQDLFSMEMFPTELQGKGRIQLQIRNEGIAEATYAIVGRDADEALRFGEWRSREEAAGETRRPAGPQRGRARSGSSLLQRLPGVRRLQSAPRTAFRRLLNAPRVALNRILPGLGSMVRLERVGQQVTGGARRKVTASAATPTSPPLDRRRYDHVIYPGHLRTRVKVSAGQEKESNFSLAPKKRPWLGRHDRTLAFQIQASTVNGTAAAAGQRHSVEGQVHVKPRIRTQWPVGIILLLLLLGCALSAYVYTVAFNETLAKMLTTPGDIDGDGLSNLAEVYVHKTDPNLADSDQDGLTDDQEIKLNLSPINSDTDNDGLLDGAEVTLGSNPRIFDTDGDGLSDSLEVRALNTDPLTVDLLPIVLAATPTPLVQATPQPAPTPLPTPTPSSMKASFSSLASEDGFVGQEEDISGLAVSDGESIQVGDDISAGRQFKGFLSFDTASIPDNAIILSAEVRLRRSGSAGIPYNLGQIHVDIAPKGGFSGDLSLGIGDFAASVASINVATLSETNSNGTWSMALLDEAGVNALDRQGVTQFRLYFTLPNDGNGDRDWINFSAGDHPTDSFHPQLIVQYELP